MLGHLFSGQLPLVRARRFTRMPEETKLICQSFARREQKQAGPAGGIQDSQTQKLVDGRGSIRVGPVWERRKPIPSPAESPSTNEHWQESLFEDGIHQRGRGVVGTRQSPGPRMGLGKTNLTERGKEGIPGAEIDRRQRRFQIDATLVPAGGHAKGVTTSIRPICHRSFASPSRATACQLGPIG
jgi:hypothetical protein